MPSPKKLEPYNICNVFCDVGIEAQLQNIIMRSRSRRLSPTKRSGKGVGARIM